METVKKYEFPLVFLTIALVLMGGWVLYIQVKSAVAQEPTFELINLSQRWSTSFGGQSQHVIDENGQIKLRSHWDSNQAVFAPDGNGGGVFLFNISETGVVVEGSANSAQKYYDSAEEAFAEMSAAVNAIFSSSRNVHGYDADKYGYRRGGMIIESSPALTIDEVNGRTEGKGVDNDLHRVGEAAIEDGFFAIRYWIYNQIAADGTAHSYLKFEANVPIFDGAYEWQVEIEGDDAEIALTKASSSVVEKANDFFTYFTGVYEKSVLENGVDEMSFGVEIFTSKTLKKGCMNGVGLEEWNRCRTIMPLDVQLLVNGTNAPLPVEWGEVIDISWATEGTARCDAFGTALPAVNGTGYWTDVGFNQYQQATRQFYASIGGSPNRMSAQVGLQCWDTLGDQVLAEVVVQIIPPPEPEPPAEAEESPVEQSQ